MKSRAFFLLAAAIFFCLVFLFWTSRTASIPQNQIGLQLYSLRDSFGRDVPGTLDKIKALGFVNVELAGTYGLTAEQFKAQLDAHGLNAISGHFPYDRFRDDAEGVAREAKTLGLKYVGCAWIPHDESVGFTESKCREAAAVLNRAGEALAKHGLKLFSHTHGYEFQPYNGGTLFDLLMSETDPRFVNFQMDIFWVVLAGQDPVKLLEKFRGRWQLLHLKGMREGTPIGSLTGHSPKTNNVTLGSGRIDCVPILSAAKRAGVTWYIIEDESPSVEEQLPKSLRYLETIRWSKEGIFSEQADVGASGKTGSLEYNPANGEYLVAGGGENIWLTQDAFHFVGTKMSGDFTLTADVRWIGEGGNPHRKACLMLRQSLEADSAYADVALHGSGLTSLQFREMQGGTSNEIQSDLLAPGRLRIEKRGDYIAMFLAPEGGVLQPAGNLRLPFKEPFYAGLAVCAHDSNAMEKAVFSNVNLISTGSRTTAKPMFESTLEVVDVANARRHVIYRTSDRIEAPNWSRDGTYFLFNRQGQIYKLPVAGGQPQLLETGVAANCNNDHGISPDGTLLAVSSATAEHKARIYVLPIKGGAARLITPLEPSYWHGWSPDGKTLAYCASRGGEFDIHTIPAGGGEERRLTTAPGLDDGPDYSPDGTFIYFNSERTGRMQIWRMHPDGSGQEQMTSDDSNNWFAHPSPDGKWIVFLSYPQDVTGHPSGKDVMLRLLSLSDGKIQVLAKLFGGQGTINVPSWSPDSRQVAFVSYQPVYP